ncbi:MAG TPA: ABC transporter ATP-binding protein [Ktedonobacterales bacterium]|nr:ABC transporter ATP-binding protein [Ktedonobacterales bacterium]
MSQQDDILEVEHLIHSFGGINAVDDCSLTVPAGKITALIGPNGAGKSTLINIVSGFYPRQQGRVIFDGAEVSRWPSHRIGRRGLIRTFQISRGYGAMTVLENLMVPPQQQAGESLFNAIFRPKLVAEDEKRHLEKALNMLDTFGLYEKRDEFARNLSGGQKRLLEMARALMSEPKLLLLDEPMAGVNPALADQLAQHIVTLSATGITFLLVEHNLGIVDQICDHVIVMANGRALATGTMGQVRANEEVVHAYLGG